MTFMHNAPVTIAYRETDPYGRQIKPAYYVRYSIGNGKQKVRGPFITLLDAQSWAINNLN